MKTAVINVRVTKTTLQQLDAIVRASLLDRSDHIRLALNEYITLHGERTPTVFSRYELHLSQEDETDHPESAFDEEPAQGGLTNHPGDFLLSVGGAGELEKRSPALENYRAET